MHEFGKLVRLQAELSGNSGFIRRNHAFIKIFDFAEGEDIYKNPQRDISMFRHIVSDCLMMLAHLTGNFLLNIAD